jgi:nicotinamide-nucleotide amidase
MTGKPTTDLLAHAVGRRLRERGLRLVAAESCTGGWLAKAVTDVAGSSAWFERGFVTYSNDAKAELLDVRVDTLARCGAVSEETAREMVLGALNHSRADIAIAITGVAGPDGGTADKPVGTVWIAWGRQDSDIAAAYFKFGGDRERVRYQSVVAALEGLIQFAG